MRKNSVIPYLVLVFVFFVSNAIRAGNAVVVGTIKNTKAKIATLSYNAGLVGYEEHKEVAAIDKKGNFKFVLDVKTLTKMTLVIDEQQTALYLQPGDNFSVSINYSDFDNSLLYSGKSGAKNNLLNQMNVALYYGHETDLYKQIAARKADKFAMYCDSSLNVKYKFINDFKGELPDQNFLSYYKNTLAYENASDKLLYPSYWCYVMKKGDTLPEMPDNYYNFLKEMSLNNDSLVFDDTYFGFVKAAVNKYTDDFNRNSSTPLTHEESLVFAELILKKEKLCMAYEAHRVNDALNYMSFKDAEKYYNDFIKKYPSSLYQNELSSCYAKTKKVSPGQPAPEFSATGLDGKKYSMVDFKGKLVFLDFWASWCGPCLRELPYAKKIKQEFEGKDILFLYISLDEDLASWKKAVSTYDIKGMHLNDPDFSGAVGKAYNITGIPSYFLIDKNGIIISNNPPRPSSEQELKKVLNTALAN